MKYFCQLVRNNVIDEYRRPKRNHAWQEDPHCIELFICVSCYGASIILSDEFSTAILFYFQFLLAGLASNKVPSCWSKFHDESYSCPQLVFFLLFFLQPAGFSCKSIWCCRPQSIRLKSDTQVWSERNGNFWIALYCVNVYIWRAFFMQAVVCWNKAHWWHWWFLFHIAHISFWSISMLSISPTSKRYDAIALCMYSTSRMMVLFWLVSFR